MPLKVLTYEQRWIRWACQCGAGGEFTCPNEQTCDVNQAQVD